MCLTPIVRKPGSTLLSYHPLFHILPKLICNFFPWNRFELDMYLEIIRATIKKVEVWINDLNCGLGKLMESYFSGRFITLYLLQILLTFWLINFFCLFLNSAKQKVHWNSLWRAGLRDGGDAPKKARCSITHHSRKTLSEVGRGRPILIRLQSLNNQVRLLSVRVLENYNSNVEP